MYWLRRPPYLRWIAAGLIVCLGILLDSRPTPTVDYPFATEPVAAGATIDNVEWRTIPAGVLPVWTKSVTGTAVAEIPAGSPLVPPLVVDVVVPAGWWAVSLPLPQPVAAGTPVRVAVDGQIAEGVLAGAVADNGYEIRGSVAFPADQAALVATLTADRTPVVMIGSEY